MKRILQEETKFYRKLNYSDFRYGMREAIAFALVPDGNSDLVEYYGIVQTDTTNGLHKPHWIYILVNPSIPGVCKIGYTTLTVYERVRQINSSTGVIMPWYPVYIYKCPNGKMLERDIHQYLENIGLRINEKREGFSIQSTEAIKIVEELGKKYQYSTEIL